MASPALTRWPGSRIVAPSIATWPARISALRRERDSSAMRAASTRSSRSPASSAATTTVSLRPSIEAMSNPDDEPPLDPAAARMVARVRWLMLISGVTTMVAIAAVLGVIGYRVFKTRGKRRRAADVTALLPRVRASLPPRWPRTASWSRWRSPARSRSAPSTRARSSRPGGCGSRPSREPLVPPLWASKLAPACVFDRWVCSAKCTLAISQCQTANALPPGHLNFRAPEALPFPFFLLPRRRGKWSAGRRRALCEKRPGGP